MNILREYQKNIRIRYLVCALYCVFLTVVLMHSLLYYGWTNWSGDPVYWISEEKIMWILRVLSWLLVVLEFPFSWQRGLLALAAVVVRWFIPAVGGSNLRLLELIILAILSNLGTKKTIAWTWLGVHLVYVVLLIYFNRRGLTADYLKPEAWLGRFGGEYGHSLGMAHPNSVGIFTLSTMLMIWYLLPCRKFWVSFILFAAAAFFCLWFTKSKTNVVLLLLSPFILWLFGRLDLQNRHIRLTFTLLPALACVVTFALCWYYHLHAAEIKRTTFWMRFEELKYIIEYFHFPFGAASTLDYPVNFDNFFVFLFTCCGYIPFFLVVPAFCYMNWRLAKDQQHLLLAMSVIFLLFSMMENCIFYPVFFFVPLLAFTGDSFSAPLVS